MANRVKGEISFEAEGKTWTLVFSVNALCELEAATGKTVAAIAAEAGDPERMSLGLLRSMVWAGLTDRHGGEVDVKRAGALMTAIGAQAVGEKVGEAFSLAFPATKGGEPDPRTGAKAGTGKVS